MSSQPPKVSFDTEHLWQMMFDEGRLVSVEKYTTDYSAPVAADDIVVVKAEPKDNEYEDDGDDDGDGDDYNQFLGLDDSFLFDIDGSGNVSLPTGPSTSTSSSSSSSSSSNATKKPKAVQPALVPSAKAPLGYTASGAPRKRRAPASKPDLRNVRPHSEQRVSTPSDQRRQAARTTRNALRSKQPPVAAPLARMKEILASLKTRGKQQQQPSSRAEYHEQVEDIVRNLQQAVESAQETASTFQNQREAILLTIRRMLMELYISRNNLAVLHAREYGGSIVHIPVGHSTMQHSTTYTPPYSPLVPVNPFHGREVEDVHYNRRKETASMPINTRLAETSKAVRGQGSYMH